jgi:outer membrane lipase/esterase
MMSLRSRGVLLILGLSLTLISPRSLQAGPFSAIYSFGDSLTDTGNAFLATGGANPPPGYFNGRFSNGPLWIDQFAGYLGLAPLTPAIIPGGTNYAVAGAMSGVGNSPVGAPNLLTQIGIFQANLGGGAADSSALYTINIGGNDFLGGQTDPTIPAANVSLAIQSLAALGATRILVLDTELLGYTPRALSLLNPIQQAGLNLISTAYSAQLQANLAGLGSTLGISIYLTDILETSAKVHANPAAYGFTNITDGAYLVGNFAATGYLYWDDIHPTTAGHALIAQRALAAIPEPSTLVLWGMGTLALGWARRRHQTAA